MMNIETLLQAAQILESQQSIPPKKRLVRGGRQTPNNNNNNNNTNNHIPASVLSSTTLNTNSTIIPPTLSIIKNENLIECSQLDFNRNLHNVNHSIHQQQSYSSQQQFTLDQNDDDDDDDDDDIDQNNQNSAQNSDISNRGQTCFRDREIHNKLEKHRRAHLKDCFDTLKAEVPCQRDRKITNLQVLNMAIKYIQALTRKEREYEQEIAMLTSNNIELQRRLGAVKTELNSEGHNVDTWLESYSDIDHSISTCTASEAEMYRTFDDDDDDKNEDDQQLKKTKLLNENSHLDTNNNHSGIKTNMNNSYTVDSKTLINNRRNTTRQRSRPSKRKISSIPTTNLLQTLPVSIPTRSENLLDYNTARYLQLDQPCNLLTSLKDNLSTPTTTFTPITDIRYDIVDMFTKGTTSHLHPQQQQHQQVSPLPSIASLMNRHSSPVVSPTKQTIGINTDPLTTSTTNILHQPVATS
ncbi:unnamed protein product [Rotaria socialis]|uniref:BHLH domain-containing protein n=1 Tax=Rotaria socialis TaxID=392032 RepID=A0A818L1Z0_9BILA|nr:unnamed protein product [Rotaria socialis]CAF3478074.1 unnamed protein product [Rotaria socialis]CAF3565795.1 unnamed protein product [Rotaria socialis]CAF3716713.1 unnamed protein product [Rotaria socialis]CAF4435843.1 unnamed protein product [Rotaria socialis]